MQFNKIRKTARLTAAAVKEAALGTIIITSLHVMGQDGRRRMFEFLEPSITAARTLALAEFLLTERSADEPVPAEHFDFPCPHGGDHVHWLPTVVDVRAARMLDEKCNGAWTTAVEAVGREHRDAILTRAVKATGGVIIGAEAFDIDPTAPVEDVTTTIVDAMMSRFSELQEEGGDENG